MAQGQGAKGQKLGRNSRAPSNAMQKQRTERNKRRHAENAHALKMQQPVDVSYLQTRKGSGSIMTRAQRRLAGCLSVAFMRIARTASPSY